MRQGLRWRGCRSDEVDALIDGLARWPCPVGGAARHMFQLSVLEDHGHRPVQVVTRGSKWAVAVVTPGNVIAPAGTPELIAAAGVPAYQWRLVVGDAAACDALLEAHGGDQRLRVHVQRFMTVDPDRVPTADQLPDPGLRAATREDVDALAELAVQLHVDDQFGPDPGRHGRRGYRRRLREALGHETVRCVGPVGQPVCKLERSVSSPRWGVQLAGIVVAPGHRGRGLGRAAVATEVRRALSEQPAAQAGHREISLHVRAANEPALRAYRAAGFVDREEWRLAVRR